MPFLKRFGMAADLKLPESTVDLSARNVPGRPSSDEASAHVLEVIQRFTRAHTYDDMPWKESAGRRSSLGAAPQAA